MFHLSGVKYKNILDIDNLNIPSNKITCVIGESGSGKTTLLRMLNKLISCDTGEILYKNQPIEGIDSVELRRDVIMLPQTPVIFKGSVGENLLIGLKFAEKPFVSDERLNQVLKTVQLNKDLKSDAEKLSGGEKQRLALARVILLNPEGLLLDEPSSSLDEETENIIVRNLVDYAKENNKTLIMVTHSKKVAEQFSENTIRIKNGKIVDQGGA
jgi:putative ABC transport system ATP-binding protein